MRKIKHISLVLTLAPLFFMGCTQEKVSRIIPSKSTDNYRQHSLSLTDNNLREKKQVSKELISESELDRLVALVKLKLAEKETAKEELEPVKKLSLVEQIPLMDPSLIEEIYDSPSPIITIADNYIDTQSDDLTELMRLVSHDLDTDINGIEGVYSTPIVINDETDKTHNIVKMLEEIKVKKISREDEIIATAIAYLDTKYIWAANGPTAFDCSGFTKYVFKENGLTIPRYSGNQAKVGIKVNYKELEVGDLVFFDTEKSYKKKVNHVGIYMGDNKFIHASSAKKKVVITSFKKKQFYKKRFLWGQRIVKDDSTYASL